MPSYSLTCDSITPVSASGITWHLLHVFQVRMILFHYSYYSTFKIEIIPYLSHKSLPMVNFIDFWRPGELKRSVPVGIYLQLSVLDPSWKFKSPVVTSVDFLLWKKNTEDPCWGINWLDDHQSSLPCWVRRIAVLFSLRCSCHDWVLSTRIWEELIRHISKPRCKKKKSPACISLLYTT